MKIAWIYGFFFVSLGWLWVGEHYREKISEKKVRKSLDMWKKFRIFTL